MVAPWLGGRMHGFDLETTGVDVETDRIVTGTFITVSADGLEGSTSWLADPGVEIPEQATALHGISTEHARAHGQDLVTVVAEIVDALFTAWHNDEPVVIYNAPYDLTLLDREIRRHGKPLGSGAAGPVIDPLVLDKRLNKYVAGKGARRLVNTCARYGIMLADDEAHSSAGDALAACRLAWKMSSNPLIASFDLITLQDAQRNWYRYQSLDFADWLDRQGNTEDAAQVRAEADDWPLRRLAAPLTEAR